MTEPQPKHPVQSRWIVYDNVEHEFSLYYDEQEAKKEYEGRIKQINDDVVGNDEYDGEEEVYLASVISKAEVVQTGIADDGDEGLYRLVSYDYSAKESSNSKASPSHVRTSDDVLRSDKALDELERNMVSYFDTGYASADLKFIGDCFKKYRQQQVRS